MAFAQTFHVNVDLIDIHDGLADNWIGNVAIDTKQNLWLGTPEGLSMFNGFEVKTFDASNSALTSDNIPRVFAGGDGKLIVMANSDINPTQIAGLYTLDPETFSFTTHPQFLESNQSGSITPLGWEPVYDDGVYYMDADNHLYCYHTSSDVKTQVSLPEGFVPRQIIKDLVVCGHNDSIWYFSIEAPGVFHDLQALERVLPQVGHLWPYHSALAIGLSNDSAECGLRFAQRSHMDCEKESAHRDKPCWPQGPV